MKYFSPSYWFKLWVLSAPLFNDKTQGINAKSIDNKKIKDWASKNTTNLSLIENQELNLSKNQTDFINYQTHLDSQKWGNNLIQELETSRHKRQARNNNRSVTTPTINLIAVDENGTYFIELNNVILFLRDNDILREIAPWITNVGYSRSINNPIYYINANSNYQTFIMPINIVNSNGQKNFGQIIRLVLTTNDLYLQGFIVNDYYYYFRDSSIISVNVPNVNNNFRLSFSLNYRDMVGAENPTVNWQNIFDAFNNIINFHQIRTTTTTANPNSNQQGGVQIAIQRLRLSLPLVILATSESIRFRRVREDILSTNNHLYWNNQEIINTLRENIGSDNQNILNHNTFFNWNHFIPMINFWETHSETLITRLREERTLSGNNPFLLTVLQGMISHFLTQCYINRSNLNKNKREISKKLYCFKKISYEFEIYWNRDKTSQIVHFAPTNSIIMNKLLYTMNLGKLNPVNNFNRLDFLGDTYSDQWGIKVKWGSWIYDGNNGDKHHQPEHTYSLGYYMQNRNYKFHDIIKNQKVYDNISPEEFETHTNILLQSIYEHDFLAWVEGRQKMGLTWYWENENYYLQFLVFQYLDWKSSTANLDCWLKIGSGIKLYNDDESARTKREIFDINNLEEKNEEIISNELKNVTKWTDNFTKSINHETHLVIDNKTNFVVNNITNL